MWRNLVPSISLDLAPGFLTQSLLILLLSIQKLEC